MAHNTPLSWPVGWQRTEHRQNSRFKAATSKALPLLTAEVRRLGGINLVISTNLPLKGDGTFRLDRDPVDPGAAVYFQREGKDMAFACDQFDEVRENLYAIAKTIEAMRAIERYGAAELVNRAFSGFLGLPAVACHAPEGTPCSRAGMNVAPWVGEMHLDRVHAARVADELDAEKVVVAESAIRELGAKTAPPMALGGETVCRCPPDRCLLHPNSKTCGMRASTASEAGASRE
jgi:hypothetical protein